MRVIVREPTSEEIFEAHEDCSGTNPTRFMGQGYVYGHNHWLNDEVPLCRSALVKAMAPSAEPPRAWIQKNGEKIRASLKEALE